MPKCFFNRKMNCHHRDCPWQGGPYASTVEAWAWIGRTPRSASLEPVVTMSGGNGREENNSLRKARVARLFNNDEAILNFVLHGSMSHTVCKNLRIGERRFEEMIEAEALYALKRSDPVFRAQYKTFVMACKLAQVSPSVHHATLWLKKAGSAYKVWKREQFKQSYKARVRK